MKSFISSITSSMWIRGLVGILASVGMLLGIQTFRLANAQRDLAELQRDFITASLNAEIYKIKIESDARAEIENIRTTLTGALSNALANKDKLIADLRSGKQRVRPELQCPPSNLPLPSTSFAGDNEGTNLRIQDAAALAIQYADECDAAITATQRIIMTDRRQLNE